MARTNPLHDLSVLDEHGASIAMSELWAAAPVVIGFVRHFG